MAYSLQQTVQFTCWHTCLRDLRARIAIGRRLERAMAGHLGDVKSLGGGLYEMRVDTGPGYRLYLVFGKGELIVLLAGGDKSSQALDIRLARQLATAFA